MVSVEAVPPAEDNGGISAAPAPAIKAEAGGAEAV